MYDEFVNISHTAEDIAISKFGFNPHTKHDWNAAVKRAHDNDRSTHRCLAPECLPRGIHVNCHRMYKRTKFELRHVHQAAYEPYMQKCYDDLNQECDRKQMKRLKGLSSILRSE